MSPIIIAILIIAVIIMGVAVANIKIVPQSTSMVIERLGVYSTTWNAGLHIKTPVITRIVKHVSLKEQVADFPPQPVITKDNVTMQVDTVVFYQITDPKLYTYGVEKPLSAIENLTATTLRNIIGDLELDHTLTSRDTINAKIRGILDEATDPWGIKVNRVELKNILPPREIQDAMEKQMRAERERREAILRAEGSKESAILTAQGEKEAAVLRAEAHKIETVKEAEGHAESIRLHKEAEASGIIAIKEAESNGFKKLFESGLTSEQIISLKSFEALVDTANGNATKIIIPSDIQNIVKTVTAVKESVSNIVPGDVPPAQISCSNTDGLREAVTKAVNIC